MASAQYTASKSRAQGRPGWTISFRHPLRTDPKGKPGLKMRRGLGTDNSEKADQLVAEMNTLLGDNSWWSIAKREEAERTFSSVITEAFYDEIQAGRADTWAMREEQIPLPGIEQDYTRAILVGTTGAGKTSLLRQLIGSDPERDRFPSTSTAKTTVSDIEVVLAEGSYSAAVTFFSKFWVQANIEECVSDSCLAVWERASDGKIAERLLNHRDQRFRLSYTLGPWPSDNSETAEDDWAFDTATEAELESSALPDDDTIPRDIRDANGLIVRGFVDRIRAISLRVIKALSSELKVDVLTLAGSDLDAAQELFEEHIEDDADYHAIVHDILDAVAERFGLLSKGKLQSSISGWPDMWTFQTADRSVFIEQIRWFSSNFAAHFGRLLTPLVDGIRVSGPLYPTFTTRRPKLVLLDGQGLGHTPDSSSSVTTHITRRFGDVDVVLLVDNAQQPMQAAPLSVFRAAAVGGHQDKLAVAFTHFDQVKGVNIPTFADKRDHVLASVTNGLANLRDVVGAPVIRAIERTIFDQCFMLGALDQPSGKLPKGVKAELERMFVFFEKAITPAIPPETHPVFNPDGLVIALQEASRGFRRPWSARLGLATHETATKEHWTRIKALNRRIASEVAIEYDSLRPVADFLARLGEGISRYLDNPIAWDARPPTEEEADAALSAIRKQVYTKLHALAERRLVEDHLREWRDASTYKGKGSTTDRAHEISLIYEAGAPIPSTVMTTGSTAFVQEIRQLVHQAIRDNGGKLQIAAEP